MVSSGDANSANPKAAAKASAKALATPPNPPKGVTEDTPGTVGRDSATSVGGDFRETLFAEAAKILKGVSLKPLKVLEGEWDEGELHVTEEWLFSAISGVSDQRYALVDSGATNALRQAEPGELVESKRIRVELASGVADLHVTNQGTLLTEKECFQPATWWIWVIP